MASWQIEGVMRINHSRVSLWYVAPCIGSNQKGKGCFSDVSSEEKLSFFVMSIFIEHRKIFDKLPFVEYTLVLREPEHYMVGL